MKSAAEQITGLCPSSSFGVQHGYGQAQIRQKISGKSETNWQLKTLSALMSIELCFHGHRISTSLSPWRGKAWLFQIVSVPYILKPLFWAQRKTDVNNVSCASWSCMNLVGDRLINYRDKGHMNRSANERFCPFCRIQTTSLSKRFGHHKDTYKTYPCRVFAHQLVFLKLWVRKTAK